MCNFASGIITRDGKVHFSVRSVSHEDVIKEAIELGFKIKDDTADKKEMKFCRFEITPPDNNVFEQDLSKWSFRIDESITPEWWNKEFEKEARKGFAVYIPNIVLIDKKDVKLQNQMAWLKNSSVEARENSRVEARENSSVEAWGNSSVVAWGNSSVEARENSRVVAWGNSRVEARENSSVEAWGNSSVVAWGNSRVELFSTDIKYSINDKGLAIIRFKDNLEIIRAKKEKVKLTKSKETLKEKESFKVGDKVKVIIADSGWGAVNKGDIGIIVSMPKESDPGKIDFDNVKGWSFMSAGFCFEKVEEGGKK